MIISYDSSNSYSSQPWSSMPPQKHVKSLKNIEKKIPEYLSKLFNLVKSGGNTFIGCTNLVVVMYEKLLLMTNPNTYRCLIRFFQSFIFLFR